MEAEVSSQSSQVKRCRTLRNTSLPAASLHCKKDQKTHVSSFSLLYWMFLSVTECPVSVSIQTCIKHPSYCGQCRLNISEVYLFCSLNESLITHKFLHCIWSSKEISLEMPKISRPGALLSFWVLVPTVAAPQLEMQSIRFEQPKLVKSLCFCCFDTSIRASSPSLQ